MVHFHIGTEKSTEQKAPGSSLMVSGVPLCKSTAVNAMVEPVRKHLTDSGCIGSISEIFDGDTPHNPRGCYAQAWSVGEVLRCYCEDILPYL